MEVERSKHGDQLTKKTVCQLPYATSWLLILSGVGGMQSRPRWVGGDGTNQIGGVRWTLSSVNWIHQGAQFLLYSHIDGRQWSCRITGVTCSLILKSRISRAAAFWTCWSSLMADLGRPARTELPLLSLDKTNEWTSWETSSWPTGWRIWRSLVSW